MIIIDAPQQSPEWYAARMGVPSASEFKRICTPAKWALASKAGLTTYITELIDEIMRPKHQDDGFAGNEHTQRGNMYEDQARKMYELITGNTVTEVGFCLSDCRTYGASPDGLIGTDGGVEIKCHDGKKHALCLIQDKIPAEHLPQVHGGMLVTGRPWWDFVSYCDGYAPFIKRVYADEKTEQLELHIKSFVAMFNECLAMVKAA